MEVLKTPGELLEFEIFIWSRQWHLQIEQRWLKQVRATKRAKRRKMKHCLIRFNDKIPEDKS